MKIIIPKEYIKKFTKDIVITRGLDNCLWLFSSKEWQVLLDATHDLPLNSRDASRFAAIMTTGAVKTRIGKDGTISIPSYLKDYADIKKKVLFIGVNDRVELWGLEKFTEYRNRNRRVLCPPLK